jgi:hypothetical protein
MGLSYKVMFPWRTLPVQPIERSAELREGKGNKMADKRKLTVAPSSHTRFVLKIFLPSSVLF